MKPPQKRRISLARVKLQSNTVFRMNVLFFTIFLLFSLLILRLGFLQIVKGEDYARAIARTEEVPVNTSVPRGRIFDSEGRIQVGNKPVNAITYTAMQTTKREEMMTVARELAKLIDKDFNKVTLRDKQDFYIQLNTESATKKVTDEERAAIAAEDITETEKQRKLDALVREKITEKELASLSGEDLEVLAIYREMTSGYALTPQMIKNEDVTDEEFARVSERLTDPDLKGINTVTDWKRIKSSDLTILGSTTTPETGIPATKLEYYLARDYSRNDRIGISFLEQQYEEVLQGQKSVVKNVTDGRGSVIETVPVDEGEAGKDIVLSIDSELQSELEKIVEDKLLELKKRPNSELVKDAYLVMMNPQTGEVLSMVGKRIGEDKDGKQVIYDYAFGTFTAAHEMGSTVKGATLLTGYAKDAVELNEVQIDEPLKFAGTALKKSIFNTEPFNRIPMTDLMAIERSSNVYMFKIAMKIAGVEYQYNRGLYVAPETFAEMRNSYAQFGLGVKTGIDLPNEGTGYMGGTSPGAKLLDLAIGQFDTYTPMQLAQYISTIANDGYRMEPHVVKEIRSASTDGVTLGPIETIIEPKILNRINNTQEEIEQVQTGMRNVYIGSSGSARAQFSDAPYTAAGKTGTAEVYFYEKDHELTGEYAINIAHVGYAPFENPEIAYAVVIPYVTTDPENVPRANNEIARAAADKYFELKSKEVVEESNLIKPPYSKTVEVEGE
ncbi:penicillin-binding transpeptidase domain-containing protein [Planococcus halocryophilus]|uniref:penicillin-binding transpeptidase domain-containing protein n=1 Tax=Planococcus halocryophilus TaxID=1215089 RepID=UPI001F0D8C23|nr:penicillin-binding transpeptidase domain-containing protein [Planococcus halocryophilus]MCH4825738.1 penicillin-binding protein 2 [Planococcus halocryophilus]